MEAGRTRGEVEAALCRGLQRAQCCVPIELDTAEDIFRVEKTCCVTKGLAVYCSVAVLVEADFCTLIIGSNDMEAFGARAREDRIDRACAFERISRPRDKFTAGGDGAIIGEDVDIVDIKGEAIMDDDAPLYAAEEVRIEK